MTVSPVKIPSIVEVGVFLPPRYKTEINPVERRKIRRINTIINFKTFFFADMRYNIMK